MKYVTKIFKKKRLNIPKIFFFLLIFLSVFIGSYILLRYRESNKYLSVADKEINLGFIDDAIALYEKAWDIFPFRPTVSRDLNAARLINESDKEYLSSYKISEQISPAPVGPLITPSPLPPKNFRVPILMYHHIRINPRPYDKLWASLNVTPQQLEDQLQFLSIHGYHTVTLDDLAGALDGKQELPANPIVLTFDDGYRSFYDNAFPLLTKYQLKATNFVITGVVDAGAYLTWKEILEMKKSALVSFGAHTKHHPFLTNLSSNIAKDEINGSKADLEKHLRMPIRWFAYPYGGYNDSIIGMVRQSGFSGALSTINGTVQSKETAFLMPRIMVDGRYSISDFSKVISE